MSIDLRAIMTTTQSWASRLGLLEQMLLHEPDNAPGPGIAGSLILGPCTPAPARSGLASTSVRLELTLRLYLSTQYEPKDDIDILLFQAADGLMAALSADFDLGSLVSNVDLLGAHGAPMSSRPGYLPHDEILFRVTDINIPLIINDAWNQVS